MNTYEYYRKKLSEAYETKERLLKLGLAEDAATWEHSIVNLEYQVKYWKEESEK